MEEGVGTSPDWLGLIEGQFPSGGADIRTYSPLALAYIGDGVYELVIRTVLLGKGNCPVNKLHRRASALVRAGAQSEMMHALEPLLDPEEARIYKRGRNAHPATMAKHATMTEYRRATGFEALMGWLYLTRRWERMMELIKTGIGYVGAQGGGTWTDNR